MLNEAQIKGKIGGLKQKLEKTTDAKERRNLQKRISKLRHYKENIIKRRERYEIEKKKKKPKKTFTELDWELKKCESTNHIKLDNSDFLKYMRVWGEIVMVLK